LSSDAWKVIFYLLIRLLYSLFFAKVPRQLPWKSKSRSELLGFSINGFVKEPIALTRAFPEFNSITDVGIVHRRLRLYKFERDMTYNQKIF